MEDLKENLPEMRLFWSFGEPLNRGIGKKVPWAPCRQGLLLGIQVGCGGSAHPNTVDSFPRQTLWPFLCLVDISCVLKMFKDPRKIVFKYIIQLNIPTLQVFFRLLADSVFVDIQELPKPFPSIWWLLLGGNFLFLQGMIIEQMVFFLILV